MGVSLATSAAELESELVTTSDSGTETSDVAPTSLDILESIDVAECSNADAEVALAFGVCVELDTVLDADVVETLGCDVGAVASLDGVFDDVFGMPSLDGDPEAQPSTMRLGTTCQRTRDMSGI
jgi:hypothetical protein